MPNFVQKKDKTKEEYKLGGKCKTKTCKIVIGISVLVIVSIVAFVVFMLLARIPNRITDESSKSPKSQSFSSDLGPDYSDDDYLRIDPDSYRSD